MKKIVYASSLAALMVTSAWAATDGIEDVAGSTATMGMSLGAAAPAKVRVWGLSDMILSGTLSEVAHAAGITRPGKYFTMCVSNSNGASVKLAVTGANGYGDSNTLTAKTAAGATLRYFLSLGNADGTWYAGNSIGSATPSVNIPSSDVQTDAVTCDATTKIRGSINGVQPPTNNTYTDTITFVATPL